MTTIELVPLPSGLFELRTSDGAVIRGPEERGFTLEEAERVADYLENRNERTN